MRITSIYIKQFRNLENVNLELKGNVGAFGNNKLGKTNFINAVYWCLFGKDLELKSDDSLNIPYGKDFAEVEIKIDNGSKLSRYVGLDHKQIIRFNDIAIKKCEIDSFFFGEVDSMNEYFMNPMAIKNLPESTLRKWYIAQLEFDVATLFSLETEFIQTELAELKNRDFSFELTSKLFADRKKEIKKEIEKWKNISWYLTNFRKDDTKAIEQAETMIHISKNDLASIEQQIVCLDNFALKVSREYQKITDVALLEKGVGDDVWKEICRPFVEGTNTYWMNGSTAEQIITLAKFFSKFSNKPMFFDEFEVLDTNSTNKLKDSVSNQLLVAKVSDGLTEIRFELF